MYKDLGRLELREIQDTEAKVKKKFKYLDADKVETAKEHIVKLLSTPNYFVRELVGKKLTEYHDDEKMDQLILGLLGHKTYGVRAATTFYYFLRHNDDPKKIINLLEMSWHDTPWETEHILYEMWNKYPKIMKKEMSNWAASTFEKQRALAYHGMETLAAHDPLFVLNTVEKNIDDGDVDLQKKMSVVLTSVIKTKPAECYPFIREWITKPSENRINTLCIVMKKLVGMAVTHHGHGKANKNDEFRLLTMQTIADWKSDHDTNVADMGKTLVAFSKNPIEDFEI